MSLSRSATNGPFRPVPSRNTCFSEAGMSRAGSTWVRPIGMARAPVSAVGMSVGIVSPSIVCRAALAAVASGHPGRAQVGDRVLALGLVAVVPALLGAVLLDHLLAGGASRVYDLLVAEVAGVGPHPV